MGVYGLLSYCLQRREQCVEYVDLVELARQRHGIQMLVDFYSFEHLLVSKMWQSLSTITRNPYLRILGGEYSAIDAYVTKLIKDLQSLDIHLVMFVDGAKGSSPEGAKQKLQTWKFRHEKDLKKLENLLDVCDGRKKMEDVGYDSVRPVLLEVQIFETLKKCKCEVVQCSAGEADYVLARNLVSRPQAYAVLSNDSDFCVFKDCMFIPNELFDLENDLALGVPQPLPDKPLRLKVGVIPSSKVVSLLELKDHDELVEVSIVGGNDFTGSFMTGKLRGLVDIKGSGSVSDIARWLHQYRKVENHPVLAKEMRNNQHYADAVQHSRQFYRLELQSDESMFHESLAQFIDEAIQHGHFPANIMAMHRKFYWHRMLLEDNSYGHPCVEAALSPLRSFIYRMVLDRKDNVVVEYGRTPWEKLKTTGVYVSRAKGIPSVNFIQQGKIFQSLRTFARIMTHLEGPDFNIRYFDRYGRKSGFTCYVLRYFLSLNVGAHLHISMDEYMAVLATAFASVEEPWYASLEIKPDRRCVTIGNWFQDIYRHAYSFLAKLLYLSHEFPEPQEIWSGAVFTGFYMLSQHKGMLMSMGFPPAWAGRIQQEMDNVIREKRHMIRYIVDGVFDFNPRF